MSNRSIQNANQDELRGELSRGHKQFYHTSGPGARILPQRGGGRGGGRGGFNGFGGMQSYRSVTRAAPDYGKGGDGRVDMRTQNMIDAHKEAEVALEAERIEREKRELMKDAPEFMKSADDDAGDGELDVNGSENGENGEIVEPENKNLRNDHGNVSEKSDRNRSDRDRSPQRNSSREERSFDKRSNFDYDKYGNVDRRDDRRGGDSHRDNYRSRDSHRDSHRDGHRDNYRDRDNRHNQNRNQDSRHRGGGKSAYARVSDKVCESFLKCMFEKFSCFDFYCVEFFFPLFSV